MPQYCTPSLRSYKLLCSFNLERELRQLRKLRQLQVQLLAQEREDSSDCAQHANYDASDAQRGQLGGAVVVLRILLRGLGLCRSRGVFLVLVVDSCDELLQQLLLLSGLLSALLFLLLLSLVLCGLLQLLSDDLVILVGDLLNSLFPVTLGVDGLVCLTLCVFLHGVVDLLFAFLCQGAVEVIQVAVPALQSLDISVLQASGGVVDSNVQDAVRTTGDEFSVSGTQGLGLTVDDNVLVLRGLTQLNLAVSTREIERNVPRERAGREPERMHGSGSPGEPERRTSEPRGKHP